MKNKNSNLTIPIEVYPNGDLDIVSAKRARQLVLESDLIWACPIDIIYLRIQDDLKGFPVYKKAGKKAMLTALNILTTDIPYLMLDAEKDINGGKMFEHKNSFVSLVSRFHRVFNTSELFSSDNLPLTYLDIPTGISGRILCPAYQRNPKLRNTLVIMGVDCESSFTNSDIPWDYLLAK